MALGPAADRLVAYSYDQSETGIGLVVMNAAGSLRQSFADAPAASWTARHGSVSFNQFGPGSPTAGMNDAGLVVTLMWNDAATYAGPGDRPGVQELEFIQYLLDNSATVDEAIANAAEIRVTGFIPIHYFVQDQSGAVAVFRPDGDRLAVTTGAGLPVPALTNSSYSDLHKGLSRFQPFGGAEVLPGPDVADPSMNSLARFAHAALAVQSQGGGADEAEAFAALETVRNRATQWQILFDTTDGTIAYRTAADGPVHRLALADMPPDCEAPPLVARLDGSAPMPATRDGLVTVLTEAFGSFPQFQAFGPTLPAEVADGQLAVMRCPD